MTDRPNPQRTCPTPAKVRHATREDAERRARIHPTALRAYECKCSWWHLTSKVYAVPAASETVTAEVVALPDAEFAELVSADVHGKATAEQAGALREPAVVERWLVELKRMQQELEVQFAQRKGDRSAPVVAWRARALLVQSGVHERLREARAIRAAVLEAAAAERARLRGEGQAPELSRHRAAVRARRRLIEAHQEEYDALLAEERVRVVVPVGERR
jgi:hypothetical protein